jgi:predicted permease
MRSWHILRTWLRSLVFRDERESELREELELHLEREATRLQASGLSADAARARAARLFGGVEQIKEACRDTRGTAALDALTRDMRYGVRRLVRDRGFTTAAVLLLGLAIGANTAIFSLVNAALFRQQAVAHADRLVNIYQNDPAGRPLVVTSYAAYTEIAAYTDVFSTTLATSIPMPARYLHEGAVRSAVVEYATASYPDVLGLRPSLGRWFDQTEERPGAPLVAVLGHRAWTDVFHADPSVIGRIVRIEGVPVTIAGVGPVDYRGIVDVGLGTDFWLPVTALPAIAPTIGTPTATTIRAPLLVKARLRDGVTVAQAKAAMDVLGRRLVTEYPDDYRRSGELALGTGMTVVPSTDVRIHPQADLAIMALASVVLAIVGLVLAIACSNVATLLLVRGAARAKEIAVRLAMGARRHHLVRQMLIEALIVSIAGGIAGCILAWWGIRALQRINLPVTVELSLDYRVLAYAIALSLATGVAFGLAPALKATRVDLLATLRDEGSPAVDLRRLTLKNVLIVFQVAVSVLLLAGTSIFLQQAAAAKALHIGYAVDGVAMLETDARFAGYSEDRQRTLHDTLLRQVQAIPGVQSAALLRGLPMASNTVPIVVDAGANREGAPVQAAMIEAGPGFFDTLRISLLFGRVFDGRDHADTPGVAVITDRMARQYFGAVNAVGRRFRLANDPRSWTEVIGVVHDPGTGRFEDDILDPIAPPYFRSYTQSRLLPTTVLARTSGDAAALLRDMQRTLRAVDVTLPVITAQTMAQRLDVSQALPNVVATVLGALGGLGLVLASIGLYAVVAFAVARRTREIGVRIALGARSRQVAWSIAQGVAGLVAVGTLVGLALSVLLMLALRTTSGDIGIGDISALGYHPRIDPLALLAIAGVTGVVGVAAAFGPGRRAARMDPLVALRHE